MVLDFVSLGGGLSAIKIEAGRQAFEQEPRAFVIAHLTFGEQHNERLAGAVAHDTEFRVQAAFRAPDTTFERPAAAQCAFALGASLQCRPLRIT